MCHPQTRETKLVINDKSMVFFPKAINNMTSWHWQMAVHVPPSETTEVQNYE